MTNWFWYQGNLHRNTSQQATYSDRDECCDCVKKAVTRTSLGAASAALGPLNVTGQHGCNATKYHCDVADGLLNLEGNRMTRMFLPVVG